ncbi:MAG: TusE/DsrC/DsvC family sulfur relay protein [Gammaproteobacteria bacterium]
MSDVLKFVQNTEAVSDDPEGNLLALDDWTEDDAWRMAEEAGIEMNDCHLAVIYFLREHYKENANEHSARKLGAALEKAFKTEGGRKYLYELFPDGPVTTASKLAGLPKPDHTEDSSFGTVH